MGEARVLEHTALVGRKNLTGCWRRLILLSACIGLLTACADFHLVGGGLHFDGGADGGDQGDVDGSLDGNSGDGDAQPSDGLDGSTDFDGSPGGDGGTDASPVGDGDGSVSGYEVGGSISGLADGASVVLQNNGTDNLTVSANGAFVFASPLASGAPYVVTVLTQPAGPTQTCVVTSGSGGVGSEDVTSFPSCARPTASRSAAPSRGSTGA